jgi:selenocysteine lyase/cysteine desulfurase
VQHPLALVAHAQRLGCRVLLDAAAYVPAHRLSLRQYPADFVALSFYKVFGYPTGVGALVARRDALAALKRPWFAGGTVEFVSVQLERHQLRALHEAFEDGTPNFLDIAALEPGFTLYDTIGADRLSAHVEFLASALIDAFSAAHHRDGSPVVRMYGVPAAESNARVPRGATVTFNVIDRDGRPVPFSVVEKRASDAGVMLRGGCFCNPGASEAAFRLDKDRMAHCLDATQREFTLNRLQQCIGAETSVGAVRASIGMANNLDDVRRAADVIGTFAA